MFSGKCSFKACLLASFWISSILNADFNIWRLIFVHPPHYFNKYLWSRIVSGIFAWDWKADFRSLKFTQDLEIRRFKFKFRIPVLVWLRPGFQIKFIQDLDSSLSLSRWFWRNRTLKLSRSLCSSGQWISNWRPEFFLQKLTTAKTVSDSGWLGLFFLTARIFFIRN